MQGLHQSYWENRNRVFTCPRQISFCNFVDIEVSQNSTALIDTVIFDMDGLLLDTEPLWGESMLRVAEKHGIPITYRQFKETTGLRIHEVTEYWASKYPWKGASSVAVADEILDDIIDNSIRNATVMPGVSKSLDLLTANGFKIGLASSSPMRMIAVLVDHFKLTPYFHNISSADATDFGKPHPAVFLYCAHALGSAPGSCLVLEDSVNGMIAGKAARMKVAVVPDPHVFGDPRFAIADAKLVSLDDFDLDFVRNLN
jgi:mannitol-1-/sugar-/sorbitol-6-/2-deoxyglucose-6-phosphatase